MLQKAGSRNEADCTVRLCRCFLGTSVCAVHTQPSSESVLHRAYLRAWRKMWEAKGKVEGQGLRVQVLR